MFVKNAVNHNIKMTRHRQIVSKVLEDSGDHPDVDSVFKRSVVLDPGINLSTVYRNIKLFEQWGLLKKHYFRDSKARYELETRLHHDHIIDIESNEVVEFSNSEVGTMLARMLDMMEYELINYNLEVYAVRKKVDEPEAN